MTISFIIGQVFGGIALIILMISFQKNEKKFLLKFQTISSLLYAIQYVFLNAFTGCFMNLTCMIRNFIFNKYNEKKIPIYILLIIIFLMVFLSLMSYQGIISLLPMFAVVFYSIALWYGNLKIIRITEIFSCVLYIIYNIQVLAITGFVATAIELIAAVISLYRFDIQKKEN